MILFRDLVYTPGANFVKLNIEGEEKDAILQDIQFHPVSEIILHADFLELDDNKKVKMEIPVKAIGNSPGVQQGGKILMRIRKKFLYFLLIYITIICRGYCLTPDFFLEAEK